MDSIQRYGLGTSNGDLMNKELMLKQLELREKELDLELERIRIKKKIKSKKKDKISFSDKLFAILCPQLVTALELQRIRKK